VQQGRLPFRVVAILALSLTVGFLAGVGNYLLLSETRPMLVERLVLAAVFVAMTIVAHWRVGPMAARALALASIPGVFGYFSAACGAQNELLFGMGDWCGTGRIMAATSGGFMTMCLVTGLAVIFLFVARRGRPRRVRIPRGVLLVGMGIVLGALSAAGAASFVMRPSTEALRASLVPYRELETPVSEAAHTVLLDDSEITIVADREPSGPTRLSADLHDGVGPRLFETYTDLDAGARLVIRTDAERRIFELTRELSGHAQPARALVVGRPGAAGDVYVSDLPRWLGPSAGSVATCVCSAALLIVAFFFVQRRRRALLRVLAGADATVDERGDVTIDGEHHRIEGGTTVDEGPAIALSADPRAGYRTTPTVDGLTLVAGTKDEHTRAFHAWVREWAPVVLLAALQLALPLLGAASVGRVF